MRGSGTAGTPSILNNLLKYYYFRQIIYRQETNDKISVNDRYTHPKAEQKLTSRLMLTYYKINANNINIT